MRTHFDKDEENGICGTYSENLTENFSDVDCKKCLKLKDRVIKQNKIDMDIHCQQMGEFVDVVNTLKTIKK